jgi:Replication protein
MQKGNAMGLFVSDSQKFQFGRFRDPGDCPKQGNRRIAGHVTAPQKRKEREGPRLGLYRERTADPYETEFRHRNWQGMRDKVRHALASSGAARTSLDRWDNCGAECMVEWSDTADRYRLRASYCKCRHCRPCAKARAGLIAMNLRNRIEMKAEKAGDRYRFITLTLKHSEQPLHDQIRRLQHCFTRLRATKFWRKSQRGGCSMVEVKLSSNGEWHPHLHILGEGDFLRQETLSKEWLKITGDSFRVDVRKIDSGKDAVHYVSKYVTKGTNDEVWDDPDKAQEWIIATRGLRTCATYGTWRGFKLLKHDPSNDAKDWKPVGLLSRIIKSAIEGSLADGKLWEILEDSMQYDPHRRRKQKDA